MNGQYYRKPSGLYPHPERKISAYSFSIMHMAPGQKAVGSKLQNKESLDKRYEFTFPVNTCSDKSLPLFQSKVPAGFPSPADDHVETRLDTNEYLIDQPDTTFFVTIQGESMIGVGLMPGDKAVVDKGRVAGVGDIVLAMIDGEFTIKTLAEQPDGSPLLLPANTSGKYTPILIQQPMQFEIWGVVTGSFRRFR